MTDFYDPNQVQITIGGKVIGGFAAGAMIEIEPDADLMNEVVGTKGDVGLARVYNGLNTCKVKLLQTSTSNDDLSALVNAAATSTASGVTAAFSFADMSGTSRLTGRCWIKKRPTQSFSDTVETREWSIRVKATENVIGGNSAAI